ncbi:NADH dehydrogenase [ubiquinone] iron-sulfur protein 5 [Elysia marginata]|uniref:NADH dehydrogenase [ubiquinone] iron-sulfur protein 5 n=1 Tax=Elysia marginata TaxID=1093978 RepID=A0AAV4HE58_9GAST|nr:NADH dehydrogenase [ubiquinone] iron-sulfur protein 5 [Elysia marginata]
MSLPVIYTPITVLQAPWDGAYRGQCGHYKMDFMRCASLGHARAKYDCKKELDDFRECFWPQKQFERTRIMEKERKRQGKDYITPLGKDIPDKGY